jgi:Transposase zinc-ribbon domain
MAGLDLINLPTLIDDAKCFALVRQHRWPEGVRCPFCASPVVIRDGYDETQPCRQRYRCTECAGRLRRSHRHGAGRPPSAAARVGAVPLLHGPEPLQPADRPGVGAQRARCADHDGSAAPRSGSQNASRAACGRGRDRRGLRGGRAQEPAPAKAGGQPAAVAKGGVLDAGAGWPARRVAVPWRRTSRPSSV